MTEFKVEINPKFDAEDVLASLEIKHGRANEIGDALQEIGGRLLFKRDYGGAEAALEILGVVNSQEELVYAIFAWMQVHAKVTKAQEAIQETIRGRNPLRDLFAC